MVARVHNGNPSTSQTTATGYGNTPHARSRRTELQKWQTALCQLPKPCLGSQKAVSSVGWKLDNWNGVLTKTLSALCNYRGIISLSGNCHCTVLLLLFVALVIKKQRVCYVLLWLALSRLGREAFSAASNHISGFCAIWSIFHYIGSI